MEEGVPSISIAVTKNLGCANQSCEDEKSSWSALPVKYLLLWSVSAHNIFDSKSLSFPHQVIFLFFAFINWVPYNLIKALTLTTQSYCRSFSLRAQCHKTPPPPPSATSHKYWVPRLPTLLSELASNWGSHRSLICHNGSQISGKYLTYYYYFIIKDAYEQPYEEVYRARSQRVLSTGTSVSMEFWVHHPFGMWMYSPTWKLIVSHCSGVFIEFNLQSSPACPPSPFLEVDE